MASPQDPVGYLEPRGTTRDEQGNIKRAAYKTPSLANLGAGSNQFTVSGTSYPLDVTSNPEYGGNYVMFNISIHQDSFLARDGSSPTVPAGTIPRNRGDAAGANYSEGTLRTVAAGAGAAWGKGTGLPSKGVEAATGSEFASSGKKSVTDLVVGAAAGLVAVSVVGGAKKEYRTMRESIALYMPTDLSIKYSVQWDAEEMGLSMMFADTVQQGKMSSGAPVQNDNSSGSTLRTSGMASYLAGKALQDPIAGKLIQKTAGVAANPKKEQLFKEVDYRTFSFTYQFFPRDKAEADAVERIIYLFKLHMHPEYKDANHFLYTYPSEFDIRYFTNGKENMHIHRHPSCVLTDLSVTYSPQGVFASFEDGMPSQINISLTFKELALMSKETIVDGY